MAQLYNDEVSQTSCIISENRLQRPYVAEEDKNKCPFCMTNTHLLEKVYLEHYFDDDCIRVVNNKYPVIGEYLEGSHDVVIDTMHHHRVPREYTVEHWRQLFEILKTRYKQLKEEGMALIQIFKNSGSNAGASIMHQHWQIIALKEIPLTMHQHYQNVEQSISNGKCKLCQTNEIDNDQAVIFEEQDWKVIIPILPTVVRETWIIPHRHISTLDEWDDADFQQIGILMQKMLNAYYNLLGETDYNICIMLGKPNEEQNYHCFIKILPRTGKFAGFELATGCMIHVIGAQTFHKDLKKIL